MGASQDIESKELGGDMKYVFIVLATLIALATWKNQLIAQERYSKISVPMASREDVIKLAQLGISLEGASRLSGSGIDFFVSDKEIELLKENGIAFTTLIPDWDKYYAERQEKEVQVMSRVSLSSNVRNFHLGSMGGALTMSELVADLDSMRTKYPILISAKDSIGSSVENRPIWAVRISKDPIPGTQPEALYMGCHHANEPLGMMSLVYFMWYLLENYGSDPEVTMLLEKRELFFVPLVNPDGYCYNERSNPGGGGMWRKNRKPSAGGAYGVDLNRNYGFKWGYDNAGSSGLPTSNSFRGTAPFSEPETQSLRELMVGHRFKTAHSFHAYADYIAPPWGYNGLETPDSTFFRRLAADMIVLNRYSYIGQSLFTINGEACDWMYGDTLSKPKIYPFVVEVGANYDGFWPTTPRILPLVEENLRPNLVLAHAAGEYVRIDRPAVTFQFKRDSATILIPFINSGAGTPPTTVDITMSCPDLDIAATQIAGYAWNGGRPLTILAHKKKPGGTNVALSFRITYPGGMTLDTLRFRLGPADVIYEDDAENTRAKWSAASNWPLFWDTTDVQAHSGRLSFSESPHANYASNLNSTFLLDSSIVLRDSAADLRFWMKGWSEDDYDCLRAEISTNGGTSWISLAGRYTSPGSGAITEQPFEAPVIDGYRFDWIEELMDLTDYAGKTIRLRFRFTSDNTTVCDGFCIDDIKVLSYPLSTSVGVVEKQALLPDAYSLDQNYPNPFNPTTTISYHLPVAGSVKLGVYDMLGREVAVLVNEMTMPGNHEVQFDPMASQAECISID